MAPLAHIRVHPRFGFHFARFARDVSPTAIDLVIALGLTLAAAVILLGRPGGEEGFRSDDGIGVILVVLQTLPLALRRVAPLAIHTAIGAALVVHSALGYEIVQAGTFASLIATFGASSLTDTRRALIAAAIAAAAIAVFFATNRGSWGAPDIAATAATWAVAWVAGVFVRMRSEQAEAAGARVATLEAEQERRARQAVADERARMARELHDIVGHALNVVVIQAAGARRVLESRPEATREALASIETAGREALVDMERLLGVLRASDDYDGAPGPQPDLADLDALAAHVTEAGIPVHLHLEGDRRDVPASVELSAYRIVQEALTNCLKHSGATRADVTLRLRPDLLEVEVVDDGRGAAGASRNVSGGRGHLGMRERVALFGGEISIGPMPSGQGYRVSARLPLRRAGV